MFIERVPFSRDYYDRPGGKSRQGATRNRRENGHAAGHRGATRIIVDTQHVWQGRADAEPAAPSATHRPCPLPATALCRRRAALAAHCRFHAPWNNGHGISRGAMPTPRDPVRRPVSARLPGLKKILSRFSAEPSCRFWRSMVYTREFRVPIRPGGTRVALNVGDSCHGGTRER